MPALTFVLLLLIPAIGGWLIASMFIYITFRPYHPKKILGFSITGIMPAIKPGLGGWLTSVIRKELLSLESLEKLIDDPTLMARLRPEIEKHIDVFLKEKLKETFPLLAGFMGEKTLASLKVAFLAEVEHIFPSVLKNFSSHLLQKWQPEEMIEKKIKDINLAEVEQFVKAKLNRQLFFLKLTGALAGVIVGAIQLMVLIYLV